jgi:predicted kinase
MSIREGEKGLTRSVRTDGIFTEQGTDWLLDALDEFEDPSIFAVGERRELAPEAMRGQAVFLLGSPAAGKTTYALKHHLRHSAFVHVDADAWKERHPDYDPRRPWLVHEWSREMARRQLAEVIASGGSFVRDGTGTDLYLMEQEISRAHDAGYRTYLIYVYVPLNVALDRAAKRERLVPQDVVIGKHREASQNFERLRGIVDDSRVVLAD